jgi:steroid delta-isomerase-like uncharacterized protein
MCAGSQLHQLCGGFGFPIETEGRDEKRRDRCEIRRTQILFQAAYMTFGITDGDGKLALGELGAPAKIFQQVPEGGKGGDSNIGHKQIPSSVYTSPQVKGARKAVFGKSLSAKVGTSNVEESMYRIVKRIVHTITTVTWIVRWEEHSADGNAIEKEITFPASHSVTEEEVSGTKNVSKDSYQSSDPALLDKGEHLMSALAEQSKHLVRRFNDAFNAGDLDEAVAVFAPHAVIHNSGAPDPLNIGGFKQFGGVFLTAFPDGELTIEDLLQEGDKVVSRITYRGTHTGDLPGIPPTGKPVTVSAMIIDRFADGKIVESWRLFDQMGMMQQLGIIPTPG